MSETAIDLKQALQIARTFNLAFNNAFMFGGDHQTTKDSSANFFIMLEQAFSIVAMITVSVERGTVYLENHCVDKLVSVARINSRFTKAGVQSVSFDKDATLESIQALFYMFGSLADFKDVATMQDYLGNNHISGVRLNYVVYQKVTVDEAIVNKEILSETRLLGNLHALAKGDSGQSDTGDIRSGLADILSLGAAAYEKGLSGSGVAEAASISRTEYDSFISTQIKTISRQLNAPAEAEDDTPLSSAEMLESVYKLKETILEHARIQQATGVLAATDELDINEVNQLSYQVIVRLIKEEYRNDKTISVKRLAQIIRRMLPDIKELKYLLPQLKDGLFAEGMSPADYLLLVKELSKELASDELMQVMVEASDLIGLTFNELVDGIKDAPEEAARLIVLASEIKNGGVTADDQQMSAVLSDYIEKVSRTLALQSPEVAASGGGVMLKTAVSRIERELLERLKTQKVSPDTVAEVAQNLASQFTETVSSLKGDWVKNSINRSAQPDEEAVLSIFEQVIENGKYGYSVTEEIRSHLIGKGYAAESLDEIFKKAQVRAASVVTHSLEIPEGVYDTGNTNFFINREIKLHLRYNTYFSTLLISYEKVMDPWTTAVLEITPDITNQLTNQVLGLLKELMKRDTDIIGMYELNTTTIPLMILPMTELAGALYIQKRLKKDFLSHKFIINGIVVQVDPRISALHFTKKLAPDKDSYLKVIYEQHCQQK
jgi:hypothetical protein